MWFFSLQIIQMHYRVLVNNSVATCRGVGIHECSRERNRQSECAAPHCHSRALSSALHRFLVCDDSCVYVCVCAPVRVLLCVWVVCVAPVRVLLSVRSRRCGCGCWLWVGVGVGVMERFTPDVCILL